MKNSDFWKDILETAGAAMIMFGAGGVLILFYLLLLEVSPLLAISTALGLAGIAAMKLADRIKP